MKGILRAMFCWPLLALPVAAAVDFGDAPVPILAEQLKFVNRPGFTGVEAAQVLGAPDKAALYLQRVRMARGAVIPPHTHPDERFTTVLSGTIYVGFGTTIDDSKAVAVPAGATYVAPAGVPHYVLAKDGEAVYQEAGFGPTGVTLVGRN